MLKKCILFVVMESTDHITETKNTYIECEHRLFQNHSNTA